MQHHVIFVPGLGDNKPRGQELVTKLWRVFGVHGHYEPMHWATGRAFAPKLQRLIDRIDKLNAQGHAVSLVGSSAGASAVLLALAKRPTKVSGVALVCGKIHRADTVNPDYYRVNPAFKESLAAVQQLLPNLDAKTRHRIISMHAIYDWIVPVQDSRIPQTKERVIPVVGHRLGIAVGVTLCGYRMMRFLKQQAT